MKILITGGAGFVGTQLALKLKSSGHQVLCMDNLMRRGSEYNVPILSSQGIEFIHGDIRNSEDFEGIEAVDIMIEASAEPSVHAGTNGGPAFVINNNLIGAINCLEWSRKNNTAVIFLSSSRVYSIQALQGLELQEKGQRLSLGQEGISEDFDVSGFKSFYGATKYCAEVLIKEYCALYGMNAVINRCGVICGEGQWGKTDQGVFTFWVARHFFGGNLSYTGFEGKGHQVRDLLHPQDLALLIEKQIAKIKDLKGEVYNVGGGLQGSVSLAEFTALCEKYTGNKIEITSKKETAQVDIPYYISDNTKVAKSFDWKPEILPEQIVARITDWFKKDDGKLKSLFS